MLITGRAAQARAQAAHCRTMAGDPSTKPDLREHYLRLEQGWLSLARSYDFAERVSGHLEWSAQRLRPYLSVMSAQVGPDLVEGQQEPRGELLQLVPR